MQPPSNLHMGFKNGEINKSQGSNRDIQKKSLGIMLNDCFNPKSFNCYAKDQPCVSSHLRLKYNNIKLVHFHRLYVDKHYFLGGNQPAGMIIPYICCEGMKKEVT